MAKRPNNGMAEQPFIYVYDGTQLTDGTNQLNIPLPMDGVYDFLLRRMAGLTNVASAFNIYDDVNRQPLMWSPTGNGMIWTLNYAMAQTWKYKATSFMLFDLFNILRNANTCFPNNVYTSYLSFQGAKEIPQERIYQPKYKWCPWSYSYEFTLTLSWPHFISNPGPVAPPRPFYININDYDFELQQLSITDITTPTTPVVLNSAQFQITLYNTYGVALSSAPVPAEHINYTSFFKGVFPVPTVVYQKDAQLRFDITSMLCASAGTKTFQISFNGRRLLPS